MDLSGIIVFIVLIYVVRSVFGGVIGCSGDGTCVCGG